MVGGRWADARLGRLAAYLRLAGFDTAYRNDYSDRQLVEISAGEDRTLLTRDVGGLKHAALRRGYFVRETQPARQLVGPHFDALRQIQRLLPPPAGGHSTQALGFDPRLVDRRAITGIPDAGEEL